MGQFRVFAFEIPSGDLKIQSAASFFTASDKPRGSEVWGVRVICSFLCKTGFYVVPHKRPSFGPSLMDQDPKV